MSIYRTLKQRGHDPLTRLPKPSPIIWQPANYRRYLHVPLQSSDVLRTSESCRSPSSGSSRRTSHSGSIEVGQVGAAELADLGLRGALSRTQLDPREDLLAEPAIGHAHHRRLLHLGMLKEQLLDLPRGDVLAPAVNLQPPRRDGAPPAAARSRASPVCGDALLVLLPGGLLHVRGLCLGDGMPPRILELAGQSLGSLPVMTAYRRQA